MNYPKEKIELPSIELKLGIKSSLPHSMQAIVLLYLIWKSEDRRAEVFYSSLKDDGIFLNKKIYERILNYIASFNSIVVDEVLFHSCIAKNPLLTAQIEHLNVAFELIWKLAKFEFVENYSFAKERTGKRRYEKKILFTSNIDILDALVEINEREFISCFYEILTGQTISKVKIFNSFIKVLTSFSDTAVYKIKHDNTDLIFQNLGVYQTLLEDNTVNLSDDNENKGTSRILMSSIREGMNTYLEYENGECKRNKAVSLEELKNYTSRVKNFLSLLNIKKDYTEENNFILSTKNFDLRSIIHKLHSINDHGLLISRYVTSLLAKPFVILTGNSGTGKTRIARQFAKYLSTSTKDNLVEVFKIGEIISDKKSNWKIIEITNDLLNCTSLEYPNRIRPIPIKLIFEYVEYIQCNPNCQDDDFRENIKESEFAQFDKFMYGYHATLKLFANEYLLRTKDRKQNNISNILIVPVGADWTDNTKILGYFNPLADDGAGVYVKTEIFRFLERANANPQIPFFLILDEMNLSHVERYFSDFLSKMEIPGSAFTIDGYGSLPYPKNLFVTGTVNIDETTYMFSPKVLDRANVIEFKPEKNSVLTSLTAEMKEESLAAEPGMAEGFLQLAEKIRNAPATDYNNIGFTAAEPILSELYDILQKAGFEFAFRTVKEIRQYLIAAYELEEEKENFSLNGHLDIQILQKILPKIYGNRQQMGTLLEELKVFFEKENFTHSLQKVTQMAERLSRFQFVSFV